MTVQVLPDVAHHLLVPHWEEAAAAAAMGPRKRELRENQYRRGTSAGTGRAPVSPRTAGPVWRDSVQALRLTHSPPRRAPPAA